MIILNIELNKDHWATNQYIKNNNMKLGEVYEARYKVEKETIENKAWNIKEEITSETFDIFLVKWQPPTVENPNGINEEIFIVNIDKKMINDFNILSVAR